MKRTVISFSIQSLHTMIAGNQTDKMRGGCIPVKKLIPVLLTVALLCIVCCSAAGEKEQPEILAIYSCPEAQIITGDDQSKELADTVIFLYQDHS